MKLSKMISLLITLPSIDLWFTNIHYNVDILVIFFPTHICELLTFVIRVIDERAQKNVNILFAWV